MHEQPDVMVFLFNSNDLTVADLREHLALLMTPDEQNAWQALSEQLFHQIAALTSNAGAGQGLAQAQAQSPSALAAASAALAEDARTDRTRRIICLRSVNGDRKACAVCCCFLIEP